MKEMISEVKPSDCAVSSALWDISLLQHVKEVPQWKEAEKSNVWGSSGLRLCMSGWQSIQQQLAARGSGCHLHRKYLPPNSMGALESIKTISSALSDFQGLPVQNLIVKNCMCVSGNNRAKKVTMGSKKELKLQFRFRNTLDIQIWSDEQLNMYS